ncbi:MAG TPA: hypothetical protein VGH38_28880 [Bryobacteraceae bacterium]|jgi:hypothetical protein
MKPIIEEPMSTADLARGGQAPVKEAPPKPVMAANTTANEEQAGPLLPGDFVQDLRGRWDRVQTAFVDEPRSAVKEADELVAHAIKKLAESFANERTRLEQQWDRGDNVNTEDLRLALRKYRSFFQRLLTV